MSGKVVAIGSDKGGRCGWLEAAIEQRFIVASKQEPIVVLIPGLWTPAWVMLPLAWRLRSRGHRCVTFGYASARASLEENAARLARFVRALGEVPVYLVGHSLGGVLALHTAAHHGLAQVGRILMAGSPYNDSYAARKLGERSWGRWMLGRTVSQWLACEKPMAPEGVDVGVIAGTVGFGLGLIVAPDIGPPHDGVIRVAETPVRGMAAYAEVHASHAGILLSVEVARLVDAFLRSGRFERASNSATQSAGTPARVGKRERD